MQRGCMDRWSLGLEEKLQPGPHQYDRYTEVRKQPFQGPLLHDSMVFQNFRNIAHFCLVSIVKKRLNINTELPEKLKISKISSYLLSLSNFRWSILIITDIICGKFSDH
jgi:hypothetical protein